MAAKTNLSTSSLQHPSDSEPRTFTEQKNVPQKANTHKTKQKFSAQIGNGTGQKGMLTWHGVEVTWLAPTALQGLPVTSETS